MEDQKYTIDELTELTGFTRRTIRYYVQEGLLDPPAGRGRGGFYYDSHVDALRKIKSLQDKGLNLQSIARQLRGEEPEIKTPELVRQVRARYEILPGLQIDVSREIEESGSKKIQELIKFARTLFREDKEQC